MNMRNARRWFEVKVNVEIPQEVYDKLVCVNEEEQNARANNMIDSFLKKLYEGEVSLDDKINHRLNILEL